MTQFIRKKRPQSKVREFKFKAKLISIANEITDNFIEEELNIKKEKKIYCSFDEITENYEENYELEDFMRIVQIQTYRKNWDSDFNYFIFRGFIFKIMDAKTTNDYVWIRGTYNDFKEEDIIEEEFDEDDW